MSAEAMPIGFGWELLPALPHEEALAREADEYDGGRHGPRRNLGFVQNGRAVAGVVYRRETRLDHYYAGDDHAN